VVSSSPRSGEAETPPRSGLSPSPRVGRGGDRRPRSRLSPSPGGGRGRDRRPRSRLSPSPGVGQGGDHRPRSRLSPSPLLEICLFKTHILRQISVYFIEASFIIW
jgi:hypothetical protein